MSFKNRHNRTLAGFDEVASKKPNININDNDNNEVKENENEDPLDKIISSNKKKDETHVLKGIYFEKEVARAIDRIARNGGKGIKSQIVNEAVKKVFKEKGWL
jgi:hypothetical protein